MRKDYSGVLQVLDCSNSYLGTYIVLESTYLQLQYLPTVPTYSTYLQYLPTAPIVPMVPTVPVLILSSTYAYFQAWNHTEVPRYLSNHTFQVPVNILQVPSNHTY